MRERSGFRYVRADVPGFMMGEQVERRGFARAGTATICAAQRGRPV
jgi:acetyl-CoA carboxylase carboxyltransferase component